VVGATVDGKIGTGTVAKIKAWQKAHGLTADGKVGAGTKRAMGLTGKGDAAPAPVIPVGPVGGASVPVPQPADLVIEEAGPAKNAYDDRKGHSIKHATIHWWGRPSRSEEHTSELQSRFELVCRLLLEKQKKRKANQTP